MLKRQNNSKPIYSEGNLTLFHSIFSGVENNKNKTYDVYVLFDTKTKKVIKNWKKTMKFVKKIRGELLNFENRNSAIWILKKNVNQMNRW